MIDTVEEQQPSAELDPSAEQQAATDPSVGDDSSVGEEDAASDEAPPEQDAASEREMKWYAVHTYSSFENRVKETLTQRIQQHSVEASFGEVLVPSETTSDTTAGGKTRVRQKVSLPGYLFVQMHMSERAWHIVKETPRVIGFIGNQTPREVPAREINGMRRGMVEGNVKPKPRLSFRLGEEVRVLDGAFANFTGTVDEVSPEKQKLKVIVSIFGRPTSVELDFATVEKR